MWPKRFLSGYSVSSMNTSFLGGHLVNLVDFIWVNLIKYYFLSHRDFIFESHLMAFKKNILFYRYLGRNSLLNWITWLILLYKLKEAFGKWIIPCNISCLYAGIMYIKYSVESYTSEKKIATKARDGSMSIIFYHCVEFVLQM